MDETSVFANEHMEKVRAMVRSWCDGTAGVNGDVCEWCCKILVMFGRCISKRSWDRSLGHLAWDRMVDRFAKGTPRAKPHFVKMSPRNFNVVCLADVLQSSF